MRILVVEDEIDLANAVARGLRREGFAVDLAAAGASAIDKATVNDYDVILLDRDLPRVHGDDVCAELRASGEQARILMLTAAASIPDRVAGLDLGADDYLGKPFDFEELKARVRALGRRAGASRPAALERAGIALEPATMQVTRDGQPLQLTRKEFAVLRVLLEADGAVVSQEQLLERAWDEQANPFTNSVRMGDAAPSPRRSAGDRNDRRRRLPTVTPRFGRPRWSIRLRLTLWYGGLFLVAGFMLLAINYFLVQRNFPTNREDVRVAAVERLGLPVAVLNPERELFQPPPDFRGERRRGFGFGEVFDGIALEVRNETLRELLVQSSVALGLMSVASVGLGWFVAGRMLRPVHGISETMREISDQRLDRRIELDGPNDELQELAGQFNVMLDRLQQAFDAQREFVSNAAHELRTPLTIMRTELDVADPDATEAERTESVAVLRRAVTRSEELIDRLLILARADAGPEREERVALRALIDEALEEIASDTAVRELRVEIRGDDAEVTGDRVLLGRLVANLVENAVHYNRERGNVDIELSSTDGVRLTVANDGAPIEEPGLDRLFARFARGERSRSRETGGTGLGLAIVQAIARAHGAVVDATARAEGGLEVSVTWPREVEDLS